MTVYFISGLGADREIFRNLRLPAEHSIVHLDWQEPQKDESMPEYCGRFAALIDTSEEFALVGLSFGGMIAVELSQMLQPKHTIIISSAGCRAELPGILRLVGAWKLYTIFNVRILKIPSPYAHWLFDTKTPEERRLLRDILKAPTVHYLKWAVRTIVTWSRKKKPEGIYHIHGTKDRVLPMRFTRPDAIVEGGGHFMVFSRAEYVSELIRRRLGFEREV